MPRHAATTSPAGDFDGACTNLARIVRIVASATAQLVGFDWYGDAKAPADYRNLLRAYARSQTTGHPLPVSDEHSDSALYGGAAGNLAFRFWHDVTHVRLGRGFDLDGEVEVALAQLDVVRAVGFRPGTLEYELFHADTLGQTLCGAAIGEFPSNQACFARTCLESSLSLAIRCQSQPQMSRGSQEDFAA